MFWQSVKACGYIPHLSEEAGSREAKVQARNTKFMSVFFISFICGLLLVAYSDQYIGSISDIL